MPCSITTAAGVVPGTAAAVDVAPGCTTTSVGVVVCGAADDVAPCAVAVAVGAFCVADVASATGAVPSEVVST